MLVFVGLETIKSDGKVTAATAKKLRTTVKVNAYV